MKVETEVSIYRDAIETFRHGADVTPQDLHWIQYRLKRMIDYIFSLLGIILLFPLFILIAILIKIDSKGPVLFKQTRVGKNGQLFIFYKFRSMVANAEEIKPQLTAFNQKDGPIFKIKNDPRITRVGKILRRTSLDELPQLWNVLKGDMSLVGPRPQLPKEVKAYNERDYRRLSVIPGITGLWQVSGRSNLSFREWLNLDLQYIDSWSLMLDIKILLKTIVVVLKQDGAY